MVVILNDPPPEPLLPLLPLLEDVAPLLEEELLRPPLEDVDPLLLPDEDELLLLVAPEDDELPLLEDELVLELELELAMTSLLLPPPPPQAATVRHEIAPSRLSSSVEWCMGSVLIQRATRRRHRYSPNNLCGKMSRSRDGISGTSVTLPAHSHFTQVRISCPIPSSTRRRRRTVPKESRCRWPARGTDIRGTSRHCPRR